VTWAVWIRPAGGDWLVYARHDREQAADAAARGLYLRAPALEVAVNADDEPPADGGHGHWHREKPKAPRPAPRGRVSCGGERLGLPDLIAAVGGLD
jgi:hypothetical protein